MQKVRQLTCVLQRDGDGFVSFGPELDIASQGDTALAHEPWAHFPVKDDDQPPQPIRVYSMDQDRQGVPWLGTQEHGVYTFNAAAFEKFKP